MPPDCAHPVVLVREVNVLGYVGDCLRCERTIDLPEGRAARYYLPFTHTSPRGKDHDLGIFVHRSLLDEG